jgi:hypothetical protein
MRLRVTCSGVGAFVPAPSKPCDGLVDTELMAHVLEIVVTSFVAASYSGSVEIDAG